MKQNLEGQRFGKRLVLGETLSRGKNKYWLTRCDCGNESYVPASNLKKSLQCEPCRQLNHPNRLPTGVAAFNLILGDYKKGAKNRNYSWELSDEEFKALITQACHYCDKPPSNFMNPSDVNGGFYWNGVDRVDNSLGYSATNCLPCCSICNKLKGTLSYQEFKAHIKNIYVALEKKHAS